MRKLIFALVVMIGGAAALSACRPSDHSREKYLKLHKSTSAEVKQAILAGDAVVGMTRDELWASCGTPIAKDFPAAEKPTEIYTYDYNMDPDERGTIMVITLVDGKVSKIDHPGVDKYNYKKTSTGEPSSRGKK